MEEWVSKYKDSIEKSKTLNRNNQIEEAEAETNDKNLWESITRLCDFTGKGPKNSKDASRMKSIFINMKAQPKVN